MTTITIPKEMAKMNDLIAIPRKRYEEFLELEKTISVVNFTASDKKALAEARKNKKKGNLLTFNELKGKLGITN